MIVVAVAAALVVVVKQRSGDSYPSAWDSRVTDLVSFVEQHRGHDFKHPVPIDFLTADEYSKHARTDSSELTGEDKQQLETQTGELRALGLVAGDVDLFRAQNDLADNATLASYDPNAKRITVRGTEMTPGLQVTLVHELTHVLQDQYFDVSSKRQDAFTTSQESSAFRTIVEGDAVRIENEYLDSLSDEQRQQAENANTLQPDDTSLDAVPVALQAFDYAPYALGPPLVSVVKADSGTKAVDDLFRTPPTTDREILDVRALLAQTGAQAVDEPARPDGVSETTDDGDLGSITWFLFLAERIDPATALDAVDGWAGDAYIAYDRDGVTCMDLAVVTTGEEATDKLHTALDQWAVAMPGGDPTVSAAGDEIDVHTCDPGAAAATNDRALDAIQLPAIRTEGALEAVDQGGLSVDKGFEYGDCLAHTITFEQLQQASAATGELPQDLQDAINAAYTTCVQKVGG
jgi:hypothetical protein